MGSVKRMKTVTFDAANNLVHMRAFPFNLFMTHDKDKADVKLGDWNAEKNDSKHSFLMMSSVIK